MKNTANESDRELLDLLQSQEMQSPAEDWSAMLNEIRSEDDAGVSAGFEDSLRRKWQAELQSEKRPSTRFLWPRLAVPLTAAAAVVAFVLLWPGSVQTPTGSGRGSSAGVAWGDVVQAMQKVEQFHVLVFDDDPLAAGESRPAIIRLDLFHQHPDRWRSQALGHVAFAKSGEKQRIWSVAKNAWIGPKERDPDILPADFIEKHATAGTLTAVLATFFGGEVPPGAPVKSDQAAAAEGIDVFDYSKDASQQWARIWVIRESKLPLKMHMYMPGSDEFMLVTFDYSDPQPPAFFDADAFAAAAAKIDGGDDSIRAHRVYSVGSKPVAGTQPRGADQIYDVQGYKGPKVLSVSSNETGDVMIVTDHIENTTPAGTAPFFEGFRKITDNWGNTFFPAGRRGNEKNIRWLYMPVPPMKSGDAPRKLNFSYVIEPAYDEMPKKLSDHTVEVLPQKSIDPKDATWPKNFEKEKKTWYQAYLRSNGTLADQLAEVERRLAQDPQDVDTLLWQHQLLRRYGRADPAVEFFAKHLRDRALADPDVLGRCTTPMSQYLLHLGANKREDEMRKMSEQIKATIEKLKASPDFNQRWKDTALLSKEHDPLYRTTRLLEWREMYKGGPTLLRTVASKDGCIFVEFEVPEPTAGWQSNGWTGDSPMGWFWDAQTKSDGWTGQARVANPAKRRLGLVFRGSGKQLTLGGTAVLQADNYVSSNPKNDFNLEWQRTIDVPAPSIDNMHEWFEQQTGGGGQWYASAPATQPVPAENAVQKLLNDGDKRRGAGQFEEALKQYEQVLAAPADQWPDNYQNNLSLDPNLVERRKRTVRIARATCLARLKRFDEARAEAGKIRSALPESLDLNDPVQAMISGDATLAEIEVAKGLLAAGDAPAADAELKRIGTAKPDFESLNQGSIMIPRGTIGSISWNPRQFQESLWQKFDGVWWNIHDALATSK